MPQLKLYIMSNFFVFLKLNILVTIFKTERFNFTLRTWTSSFDPFLMPPVIIGHS